MRAITTPSRSRLSRLAVAQALVLLVALAVPIAALATVDSISPASLAQGATLQPVTITGSGFNNRCRTYDVTFSGSGVTASGVSRISDSVMTAQSHGRGRRSPRTAGRHGERQWPVHQLQLRRDRQVHRHRRGRDRDEARDHLDQPGQPDCRRRLHGRRPGPGRGRQPGQRHLDDRHRAEPQHRDRDARGHADQLDRQRCQLGRVPQRHLLQGRDGCQPDRHPHEWHVTARIRHQRAVHRPGRNVHQAPGAGPR